jgi:hypothetical protein
VLAPPGDGGAGRLRDAVSGDRAVQLELQLGMHLM